MWNLGRVGVAANCSFDGIPSEKDSPQGDNRGELVIVNPGWNKTEAKLRS